MAQSNDFETDETTIKIRQQDQSRFMTDEAQRLYRSFADAIYQIQVIDTTSAKKSSIGSGFAFGDQGFIATNYHVVADAVQRPSQNRIEFLNETGESGRLKLIAIDIVNDIAILEPEDKQTSLSTAQNPLVLGSTPRLSKGAKIFSLGNPHDIGFTIIEGTYNGFDLSLNPKIHFSGALNSGMSGGPALDHRGQVIGLNVSTAGHQISFLIPVEYLKDLAEKVKTQDKDEKPKDFTLNAISIIEEQLYNFQDEYMSDLINAEWETVSFGSVMVPGRIAPFFKCWGGVGHTDGDPYQHHRSTCTSQERIFLEENNDNERPVTTGTLIYRYDAFWANPDLNPQRFYTLYQNHYGLPLDAYRNADEQNVTSFACDTRFITLAQKKWKISTCTRSYKKYPRLIDMHVYLAQLGQARQGLLISFVLQGVSRENSIQFLQKFLSTIKA